MFTILRPTKEPIVQHFGEHPEYYQKYGFPGHEGVDFKCSWNEKEGGEPIHACADGIVRCVETIGNYGLHITVDHVIVGDGGTEWRATTIYAHLSKSEVWKGKKVKAGEFIALSGNSGNSGGPHLHLTLEVRGLSTSGYPDNIVDPEPFFTKEGK